MDDRIGKVIAQVEAFIADRDDALALPREAAKFVYALLLATGARRGLEIGTSYGYSGLWIAAAMQENDGQLVTIDRERHKSEIAAGHFASAGVGHRVCIETGVAIDVLPRLEGPFDFVLVDADKPNCRRYVEGLLDMLAPRGVVLTDNTLTHPHEMAGFLAWVRGHPAFSSAHVPIGNGMELSVRNRV